MPIHGSKRTRIGYIGILAAVLLWCGLIVGAPWLQDKSPPAAVLIRLFFAPVCHQEANRSFHVSDKPFAVCARCTGIYAGFLAGVLIFPALRKKSRDAPFRRVFLLAAVPTAAEFGLAKFDLIPDCAVIRALTGFVIGAVVATCVMSELFEILKASKP